MRFNWFLRYDLADSAASLVWSIWFNPRIASLDWFVRNDSSNSFHSNPSIDLIHPSHTCSSKIGIKSLLINESDDSTKDLAQLIQTQMWLIRWFGLISLNHPRHDSSGLFDSDYFYAKLDSPDSSQKWLWFVQNTSSHIRDRLIRFVTDKIHLNYAGNDSSDSVDSTWKQTPPPSLITTSHFTERNFSTSIKRQVFAIFQYF